MKTKAVAWVLVACLGAAPVSAFAGPGGGGGPQAGGPGGGGPGRHGGGPGGGGNWGGGGGYRHGGPGGGPGGGRWGGPGGGGGPGPMTWRRGDRYWGGSPWVNDWRTYPGLYAPPYGYRWVQAGNQFLLTAVATGVISAIVAGSMR
ncbi:MAG: RcnB family protein [Acetobacter papayae]|uniref:RcnB family protein n=3 Tax=Acetobacter papayae TaxID=1076592 RepID=UPI0039ECFEEF